jgi:hypothetical protein
MPTRKQRRRSQKERRHEYETVWVDGEGNELDEPPEDVAVAAPAKRDGTKPKTKAAPPSARSVRVPPPPSWERAAKRSLILGVVIFVLFYILGSKNGGHSLGTALLLAGAYTILFIPFSYGIDRFTHNRFQRRAEQQGQKQARKR